MVAGRYRWRLNVSANRFEAGPDPASRFLDLPSVRSCKPRIRTNSLSQFPFSSPPTG